MTDPVATGDPDEILITDLLADESRAPLDEDGRPLTRENEMVEPADQEDLEYRETAGSLGAETADVDADPAPLAWTEE